MMFVQKVKHRYTVRASSVEDMLQQALQAELQQWGMYVAYQAVVRGPGRDGLSEHFLEHAEDEQSHAETLQRHLVGRGIDPTRELLEIPDAEGWEDIIQLQAQFEQKAIDTYQSILDALEDDDSALRIDIENILVKEQEHLHDLQLYLTEQPEETEEDDTDEDGTEEE